MTVSEIAKELTLAAINTKLINPGIENKDNYVSMNEQLAENVAAFYNKLVEKLNISNE